MESFHWLKELFTTTDSVAHIVLLYAIVIAIGVYLGKIKIFGISLGVTFVLFVGILVGHLYNTLVVIPHSQDPEFMASMLAQNKIINFVKELGLILFVYCIGLQVGPGFFATFKKGGVGMNVLSVCMVLLNVAVMLGLFFLWYYNSSLTHAENSYNLAMMVGVMYGAVTNTPGLGAANSVLPSLGEHFEGLEALPALGNGYACAYPLGVVGIIGATILLRYLCHGGGLRQLRYDEGQAGHQRHYRRNPRHLHHRLGHLAELY